MWLRFSRVMFLFIKTIVFIKVGKYLIKNTTFLLQTCFGSATAMFAIKKVVFFMKCLVNVLLC